MPDAGVAHARAPPRRPRARTRTRIAPPGGVYLSALSSRLATTCSRRTASASTHAGLGLALDSMAVQPPGGARASPTRAPARPRRGRPAVRSSTILPASTRADVEQVVDEAREVRDLALDDVARALRRRRRSAPRRPSTCDRAGDRRRAGCAARGRAWRGTRPSRGSAPRPRARAARSRPISASRSRSACRRSRTSSPMPTRTSFQSCTLAQDVSMTRPSRVVISRSRQPGGELLHEAAHLLAVGRVRVARDHEVEVPRLLRGPAERALELAVEAEHPGARLVERDHHRDAVHHGLQELALARQRDLGPLALGDVDERGEQERLVARGERVERDLDGHLCGRRSVARRAPDSRASGARPARPGASHAPRPPPRAGGRARATRRRVPAAPRG